MSDAIILDRAVIKVTGDDAQKLLNDTLTGRIVSPMGLEGRWFALLSPQGKIQVEGLVTEADAAFWLDMDRTAAPGFLKRMRLYKLRAKVEFEEVTESIAVAWSLHGAPPQTSWAILFSDQRNKSLGEGRALGLRALVPRNETAEIPTDTAPYNAARAAHGIAEMGMDFAPDTTFPHDIGMDLLGGIDFVKGCYIGQEVVSRMKHRGTARRRPVIVSGIEAVTGTPVLAGGREAGTLGEVVDGRAVAILRLDRVTDLGAVTVDGKPVTLTLPGWATYRFGEVSGEE